MCEHQFILIEQVNRPEGYKEKNTTVACEFAIQSRDEYGAMVGCALCGEIRTIWSNGELAINRPSNDSKE